MINTTRKGASVRLKVTQGGLWVICPACSKGKVLKLRPDTSGENLTIYCHVCRRESLVHIADSSTPREMRVALAAPLCM